MADGPTKLYDNLCVSKRVCHSMQPWVHYIPPPALGSGRLTCAWNLGAQSPARCNQVHLWDSDCEIVLVQSWAAGLRGRPVTNDFHPSLQWPKSFMVPGSRDMLGFLVSSAGCIITFCSLNLFPGLPWLQTNTEAEAWNTCIRPCHVRHDEGWVRTRTLSFTYFVICNCN